MSSGSSGRYQSRLFNFVHQQSRRLTEKFEYTFRHLQVATKWGVEALLYPVYLLFQSAESAVKTIYTKEPPTRLKLQSGDRQRETPLTVDTPILQILEVIQQLPLIETSVTPKKTSSRFQFLWSWWQKPSQYSATSNTTFTPSLTISANCDSSLTSPWQNNTLQRYFKEIQGIATNLENRRLVLVTVKNEILDILTPQQQTKLVDRIISEVAHYWHNQQLVITEEQTNLLPEIQRLLAKLTGEASSDTPTLQPGSPELPNRGKILELLDLVVAKLETKTLMPVQQHSQNIIQISRSKLNVFLYGQDQSKFKGNITITSKNLETPTLNLSALIEAAINYFFGVGKRKNLQSGNTNSYTKENHRVLPKSRQLQNQNVIADTWLSWSDLFGNSELANDQTKANPGLSVRLSPQKELTLSQPKIKFGLVKKQKSNRNLTSSKKESSQVLESDVKTIAQNQSHNHQVEIKPDWIEIKATAIAYEKHFLEKILQWLDCTMLWLEEIFVKTIHLLQSVWQGK